MFTECAENVPKSNPLVRTTVQFVRNVVRNPIPLPVTVCISTQVRHYVRSQYEAGTLFDWSKVLGRLSEQLQGEIANSIQQKWLYSKLQGNRCFQGASTEAVVAIAEAIEPRSFGQKESLIQPGDPASFMFLIQRGIILCEGKFIRAGWLLTVGCQCWLSVGCKGASPDRICYTLPSTKLKRLLRKAIPWYLQPESVEGAPLHEGI